MATKKMIIISKLFLFTPDNNINIRNLWIINEFLGQNIEVAILARYDVHNILSSQLPPEYKNRVKFISRRDNILKDKIKNRGFGDAIISLLGIVDEDAVFSFNCRIPLFSPQHIREYEMLVESKVVNYGLPISEFRDIGDCYRAFEIHKDNYFRYDENDYFSVISLNNANTYYRPDEEVRIKQLFETNLKGDADTREHKILLLLLFHLINEVVTNTMFDTVDFWGTFPSSTAGKLDTSASFLKEAVRVIVRGRPNAKRNIPTEIFIRHNSMKSKHSSNPNERINNKCAKDFDTLVLNPELRVAIKGKVICIIDDYITNGYSAESAKHILLNAGASKVIFLSMGKFGIKYYYTAYEITGDVTSSYSYRFLGENPYIGGLSYNRNNDDEILDFGRII